MPTVEEMIAAYEAWPGRLREAYEAGLAAQEVPRGPRSLVVCGMGGSGIAGDYAASLASRQGAAPVAVVKSFDLPAWVGGGDLVVLVSFSGETSETINCYRAAGERGAARAVVASGGRLAALASGDGVPLVRLPRGPAARTMFASLLGAVLGVAEAAGVLEGLRGAVEEATMLLGDTGAAWGEARALSRCIGGRVPVFLACCEYEPLAWRAKNEFNENAKVQGKVEVLPEWGHNDVEGWLRPVAPESYAAVALEPPEEPHQSLLRHALDVLAGQGVAVCRLGLRGETLLARLMWGTLVVGLASLAHAEARGVDPTTIPLIREYRGRIRGLLERG